MTPNTNVIIQWFAQMGERYVNSYLSPHDVNVDRLRNDPEYGLKLFLSKWAYERNGAARGYRVAAVKAVSAAWPDLTRLPQEYAKFYRGAKNDTRNPCMDPDLARLSIPEVTAMVERGALAEAYKRMHVRGIAHKIASFFLCDVITVTRSEGRIAGIENYLYCQPIDVWVRITVDALALSTTATTDISFSKKGYRFSKPEDLEKAISLIYASLQAGVSPLRVNQGIWYFSSNAVGDEGWLKELLRTPNVLTLAHEITLMDEFMV